MSNADKNQEIEPGLNLELEEPATNDADIPEQPLPARIVRMPRQSSCCPRQ